MGLGVEAMRAVNERLVYASITGFGLQGPLAGEPAYDTVLQALTGVTWAQRDFATEEHRIIRIPVIDLITGLQISQAITAALLERERSGKGQHVELSLLASALALVFPAAMQDHVLRGDGVEHLGAIGDVNFLHRTADGWMVIQPGTDTQCSAVASEAGREDWFDDPRFATPFARMRHFGEWTGELNRSFTGRTSAEWRERLAGRVPLAAALDPEELLADPGIRESKVIRESRHPRAGEMLEVRPPAVFSRTPSAARAPAPALGEHTDEILREHGLDDARIAALRRQGVVG